MKTFMVILMGFISVSTMYSQEKSASPKYALSFGIADNFRLDKFIMDIGITKILDDEHRLRLFLSPRILTSNLNEEFSYNDHKNENKSKNNSLSIGADFLFTLVKEDDISLYTGPGLVYTFGLNNNISTSESSIGGKQVQENNLPYYNIGFRGNLGVEWMVSKRISIHSEYVLTGAYNHQKTESTTWINNVDQGKSTRTTTGFSLATGVLFGVSIYL